MAKKSEGKKLLLGGIIGMVVLAAIVIGVIILLQPTDKGTAKLSLSPQEQTMAVGETQILQLVNHTDGGKLLPATWKSSSTSVATVNESGLVTAVSPGSTTVQAIASIDGIQYTASAKIKVAGEQVDLISIDGSSVPAVEREFLISQKTANVKDYPMQGRVEISDDIKDTYMIFAAGKGTDLHSDAWELTGTITKEDMAKTLFMSFGVIDENNKEQWFCILDECMSLQRFWNWWDTRYEPDGIHVAYSEIGGEFFYGKRESLSFKIVVKDDIFRAYFGTSPSSVQLFWELPLTDERFGGFAEGSKYQLAINTVDPNNMVISNLKTVTGDAVQFDSQQMPGPSANLLSVWNGKVSFKSGTGVYTMGEGDATAMTPKTYREVELSATFCPDVWPIQGFAVKQGENLVTFKFGSEGYDNFVIRTAINGVDGPFPATAFDFSLVGAFSYEMKMTYDGANINFLTQRNGKWECINMASVSLADLLGADYDPELGVSVGLAGFNGCGRQFKNVRVSNKVTTLPGSNVNDFGPLSVHNGNVVYDAAAGMYIMGDGDATALTEKAYTEVDLSANFCPNTWPIQGFAIKQGENTVTLKFGSEGYNATHVQLYKNGTMVSAPEILYEFSLYGAQSYDIKLIYKNGEAWLYFKQNGVWTQLSKYPIVLKDILGNDFDSAQGIAVGVAGFDGCGRQIRSIVISEEVTLTPELGLWDHYGVSTAILRAEEYGAKGENGVTTVFVGDSFMDPAFWTTFIGDMSGREALCLGIGGSTAEDWLGYLDEEIFLHNISPKNIVFNLGNNDLHNDGALNVYLENMKKLLQTVHNLTPDSKLFMFSVAHRTGAGTNGIVDQANAQMQQWCAEQGWVTFVNVSDQLTTDMLFDGIHPQTPYYRSIFLPTLEAAGCVFEGEIIEVESKDVLPVHTGNVTYNENTGMYVMGTGANDNPTAMTEKVYTDVELTATFCPDTWPVQGFAVKQGSNTVTFRFGSEGYDTQYIITAVNGAAVASNPATAFDFSLVGAYSYDLKLTYADGNINIYLNENEVWKQINAEPISLDGIINGFYKDRGISVGIAGFFGCGRQFSNVSVTGTEGSAEPPAADPLPVHDGNVTYDAATGMYVMGTGTNDNPTAMTEKAYTDVELTATFCPDTWPVQGFAVKQGSQTVTFKFGSEGYDTNHIMVAVNGAAVASNPATAFDFSLVGAYSYNLKLAYADGSINIYLNENGTWKQINTSPISLGSILNGFHKNQGVSVGIAGFYGCGRQFSNVSVTGQEAVPGEDPGATPDILTEKNNMDFLTDAGLYYATGATPYAVVPDAAKSFTLEADFLGNGQGWPIMGFAVKQGNNWTGFYLDTAGGNPGNYIHVFKGGVASYNSAISIAPALQMGASSNIRLKMVYADGAFHFYIKNGEEWKLLNATPYTLEALNTVCGNIFTADGFQVGVAGYDGCTGAFSNAVYTKEPEPVADPDILTVKNNMDFLTDSGLYYATGATPYAVVPDAAKSFTLEADFLGNGQGWPIMGFAVKQGDNWAGFYLDTVGGNPGNYIHVFKGGVANYNSAIPITPALQMGVSSNIRLKMVYADGAFHFYIQNGEEWKLLNAAPYTLESLNNVCGNIFTADGFQAGVAGYDGCTGAFSNITFTKTGGATRRSPAEPIVIAVLPVSSEQEKIMSILMHMEAAMYK